MKKFILFFFIIISMFSTTFGATTLYQKVTENKISTGTTLKNYVRFTDKGWLNINVLEIDLTDKYTKLGLITSTNGVGTLQNLKSMATSSKAVAAINGDFFASGGSSKGNAVGFSYSNNEVITSSYPQNALKDTFASFLLDEDNNSIYKYISSEVTLTSKKTKNSITVDNINKYSDNYSIPTIYTRAWGEYSHGSQEDLALTEMVVENNVVKEIRYNQDPALIPEDGYVVATLGAGATFINENFKVGYKVILEITPDFSDIDFAISGGAQIVKNGEIPTFTSNITGSNPRTAIGSSKNNEIVYLVTVDGRQTSSIGMTQTELAQFLIEIDVYNAINLDGGGSTTMVARNIGDTFISTINSPSGGTLRSVINGIGVFSTSTPSSTVKGLAIEIEDTNVFINNERDVLVKAFDKNYNPIEINQSDVVWSYKNGVPVVVQNQKISGDTVGYTELTATYKGASTTTEINILSAPNELEISPKKTTATSGKKVTFSISAKNKNGYYAKLNEEDVTWKIESKNGGTLENNVFYAINSGDYIISASSGNAKTYALVTVSGKTSSVVYDFENMNYRFDPYPDEVGGDAVQTKEQAHSRKLFFKIILRF